MGTLEAYWTTSDPGWRDGIGLELPSLMGTVGEGAENAPEDVALVKRAMLAAGIGVRTDGTAGALIRGIKRAQRLLAERTANPHLAPDGVVKPGGGTERGFRLALSLGLLQSSGSVPERSGGDAHHLFRSGLARARSRLDAPRPVTGIGQPSPTGRAHLPPVEPAIYVENRRIARSLRLGAGDGRIDRAIAQSLEQGGRQGFVDIRDF
ncbi:MAG: hypothetical protein O2944_10410, partial [Proteobacteria bacterium]|nr:hypothetical protein [Pseudomonadota bacterium]